jgi:hypothetical protein
MLPLSARVPGGGVARWSWERRPFLAFAATPAPTTVSIVGGCGASGFESIATG